MKGEGRRKALEVIDTAVASAVVIGHFAGLHLVYYVVELVAQVFAKLLPHASGPAGHALRIVFVDVAEARWIGQVVEPALFGLHDRHARNESPQLARAT